MSKYSYELKLKIVKEYLSNNCSYGFLAKKYKLQSEAQIKDWLNKYEQHGEKGLKRKLTNTKYSGEFKLRVINYRQTNGLTLQETANHFGISQGSTISNWIRKYDEEGFSGLISQPTGRPRGMPNNIKKVSPKKLNESEREELIRLREENEYLKARHLYEKKLRALVQERERKTKKRRK